MERRAFLLVKILIAYQFTYYLLCHCNAQCIYNMTHCSCSIGTNTGHCLRKTSGDFCNVDYCASAGLVCDCAGSDLCKVSLCDALLATSGVSCSDLQIGDTVLCGKASSFCLAQSADNYTSQPVPGSTSPSPSPRPSAIYNKVLWGDSRTTSNSFNLTSFIDDQDTDDWLRFSSGGDDQWRHGLTEARVITFRIYDSVGDPLQRMICAIINPQTGVDDGKMDIMVAANIKGESGQTIQWTFCDGGLQCIDGASGNELSSSFNTTSDRSEGFCFGNFEDNGNIISVRLTNIWGIHGIAFQEPGGTVKRYDFMDGFANELSMIYVDTDGLVVSGSTPEIKFRWTGFLVS